MSRKLLAVSIVLVLMTPLLSCTSREQKEPEPRGRVETIAVDKIQRGPIRQAQLTDEQMTRLRKVHATFAEVDGQTLAQWEDDFKRDADPDKNLGIWEDMEVATLAYCKNKTDDLPTKKEVFKVVLLRSMAPTRDVLRQAKLNILTQAQAMEIMGEYPSDPMPVEVIRKP